MTRQPPSSSGTRGAYGPPHRGPVPTIRASKRAPGFCRTLSINSRVIRRERHFSRYDPSKSLPAPLGCRSSGTEPASRWSLGHGDCQQGGLAIRSGRAEPDVRSKTISASVRSAGSISSLRPALHRPSNPTWRLGQQLIRNGTSCDISSPPSLLPPRAVRLTSMWTYIPALLIPHQLRPRQPNPPILHPAPPPTGPPGSEHLALPGSGHECRSSSSPHPGAPAAPAPSGYRTRPEADGSQRSASTYGSSLAFRSHSPEPPGPWLAE